MLPTTSHNWALWLHANLEEVQHAGGGRWQGTLPGRWDFAEVVRGLEAHERLGGIQDERTRRIEFYPVAGGVFESIDALIRTHPRRVPALFAVRDLGYDSAASGSRPDQVVRYVDAVKLWGLLTEAADHVDQNGGVLHFIKSHDDRLAITADYGQQDLIAIPALNQFASEFVESDHHKDQKRSILRTAIIDRFKGQKKIAFAQMLPAFDAVLENVRSSYSMYVSEFSFEKVKAEIEKDNLESTLKLNKTFSEIQNQLLAIPLALVLVASQITPSAGWTLKNGVIWLGASFFTVLMAMLVHNQFRAIAAIGEEINLRWHKIKQQPIAISSKFERSFTELRRRQRTQRIVLWVVAVLVGIAFVFSTIVFVKYSLDPVVVAPTPAAAQTRPAAK